MKREYLQIDDGTIYYPEFDDYLVGIVERCGLPPALCYDRDGVIAHLVREMDGDEDAAIEFFEFNILGAYVGPTTPFFLDRSMALEGGGMASEPDGEAGDPGTVRERDD